MLIALTAAFTFSCSSDHSNQKSTPEVNITSAVSPADGLDFKLVGTLFQNGQVTDAESLEKELNKEGGINNLDLDGDKNIDYINVSENTGTATVKSFDLTTGKKDDPTYIGTVEVEKGTDGKYNIHMSGSEQLYGSGHSYHSSFTPTLAEVAFYHWLFSPRPMYYHSPYYYGHYPTYYRPHVVVTRTAYTTRTSTQRQAVSKTVTKDTKKYTPKTKSTNKGKVGTSSKKSIDKAKKARTSINNSKSGNKNFKKQNSKNIKKGGFTKNKPKSSSSKKSKSSYKKKSSSSSYKRSSGSRSRGGGRRSDATYKTNVHNLDNALSTVTKLEGVTYNWNPESFREGEFDVIVGGDFDSTTQVGFIAQDVETVAPMLVITDEYGKKVNYDLTVAYLVEAIKSQQIQIQALQQDYIRLLESQPEIK